MTTSSVSDLTPTFQKIDRIQDTARLLDCVRSLFDRRRANRFH